MTDKSTDTGTFHLANADAHFSAQRMNDAASDYRRALAVLPHDAHALHRLALTFVHLNDLDQAAHFIERALQVSPDRPDILEHAGLLAGLQGRYDSAEECYRRAILLSGGSASLQRNLADCLRLSGDFSAAIDHYLKSLEIEPQSHHANRALARIYTKLGRATQALEFWLRAWALLPAASQEDLDWMASVIGPGDTDSVEGTVKQILVHSGRDLLTLKAVGYLLIRTQRYQEALEVAMRGLAIDADDIAFRHHVGSALRKLGRVVESRPYLEAVAKACPYDPHVQYQFSTVLLCLGEFEEGWKLNGFFYERPEIKAALHWPPFPVWNGEPIHRRQFLLVGEQGLGDQIQFLRFAVLLHQQGAIVDVLVESALAEIAAGVEGIRNVFTTMPVGPYDFWCHMFRVPDHIKFSEGTLPVAMPYLSVLPQKALQWRTLIENCCLQQTSLSKKRVGIVWAGNPNLSLDCFRSLPLDLLQRLIAIDAVTWFSLQKGPRERESEVFERESDVHTLGPRIQSFSDTLAILHSMDLLITVDSSVAHLAGAAGLSVWTLIPAYTEWRWTIDRTDSPWYPSMKLFRQRELGDWAPVIDEVRNALREWCTVTTA